jgi:hypothetical protein
MTEERSRSMFPLFFNNLMACCPCPFSHHQIKHFSPAFLFFIRPDLFLSLSLLSGDQLVVAPETSAEKATDF